MTRGADRTLGTAKTVLLAQKLRRRPWALHGSFIVYNYRENLYYFRRVLVCNYIQHRIFYFFWYHHFILKF